MTTTDTIAILNRILILHHRSLPAYLSYAVPWVEPGNEIAPETLELIVAGHSSMVDRIGQMILDEGGTIAYGDFPLRYASLHDLSFDYLRSKIVEYEQQMIAVLGECAEELRMVPTAQAVALEALGEAKAHLQSLQELSEHPAAADA